MRVPRTFVDAAIVEDQRVTLPADVAHHWRRVLRLREGSPVRLFNGAAGDWLGRLVALDKKAAAVDVEAFEPRQTESPLHTTLIQGISRGQRMDYTLEKAVELGVDSIVPVVMERSHGAPTGERVERKAQHWRGVVRAAAAQAARTRLPEIADQAPLTQWLRQRPGGDARRVMLDPEGDMGPAGIECGDAIEIMAGPEGGFTAAEREAAHRAGFSGLRMGPRVLRTETAAVAALTLFQGLYGDLG